MCVLNILFIILLLLTLRYLFQVNGNRVSGFENAPASNFLTVYKVVTARSITECGFTCMFLLNSMCAVFGWNEISLECAMSKIETSTSGAWGGRGTFIGQ